MMNVGDRIFVGGLRRLWLLCDCQCKPLQIAAREIRQIEYGLTPPS